MCTRARISRFAARGRVYSQRTIRDACAAVKAGGTKRKKRKVGEEKGEEEKGREGGREKREGWETKRMNTRADGGFTSGRVERVRKG